MPRDNFTPSTKGNLAQNVHFRCVLPGCPVATHAAHPRDRSTFSIGNAAHITAASQGGPRFDHDMTPEQRRAYENGAWLCPTHATLVDRIADSYPPHVLEQWQIDAENRARGSLTGVPLSAGISFSEICNKLEPFIKECRSVHITIWRNLSATAVSNDAVNAMYRILRECPNPGWRPLHKWHSLHELTFSIQQRAVRALAAIYDEVTDRQKWYHDEYDRRIIGAGQNNYFLTPQDNDRIDRSAEVVALYYSDFHLCLSQLNDYASGQKNLTQLSH